MSTAQRLPIRSSRPGRAPPRLTLAVIAVTAFTAVAAAHASASNRTLHGAEAPGGIGLRLLDAPVSARDDPRARIYIVDHLNPGTTIDRRIEVSNTTDSTVDIALYAAAASIEDGSFLGAAGRTANDLSTWTSVVPGEGAVPAGGRLTANVTIAVPSDAAPGEQYGVVWAEARSAPNAGGGVTQVSRVGIRLYVSVGPGGAPAADFTIDSLRAQRSDAGAPMVVASVHNTGGRALDMSGTLDLRGGPGGLSAGPFPASLGTTLAIGATEPVTIVLDKALPAGPWDAEITLRSGLIEESASATITFPAAGSSVDVPTTSAGSAWPKAVVALLLGGALVALVLFIAFRRRRRARLAADLPAEARPIGPVVDLRPTILICDDEADIRRLYREAMDATGAIVVEATDGAECLRLADATQPDLILLDLVLPGLSGLEVLSELRRRHPGTPVVVMSGVISDAQGDRSRELGATESFEKLGMIARIPELVARYRHSA